MILTGMTFLIIFLVIYITSLLIMYFYNKKNNEQYKEEINKLKKEIFDLNQAKSNYLAGFFHKIKTPLNAIVGFSECIKQEKNIDSCYVDADNIIQASKNLLEVVNNELDVSKIEANKTKIVLSNYKPKKMFRSIIKTMESETNGKMFEFNFDISNDLPDMLLGDSNKLNQIVTSLLFNAFKHTEHGYVNLNVKCINDHENTELIISIKDTGKGIKEEDYSKIYTSCDYFDQKDLRLSTIKKLIEMMDGTINVESKYQKGSKITIILKQKIVKSKQNINIVTDLTNKKVLIVDDNNLSIKVCKKLLSNYNLDVTSVESGLECIELLKNNASFDLILMDDMMPNMNGVETLNNLKKLPGFNTPIIILTANDIVENRDKYFTNGFSDCLAKPIDKNELNRVLVEYLNVTKEEEKVDSSVPANSDKLDLTDKKILVVDDDNLNLKVTEHVLKEFNPTVISINSGKQCINRVQTESYDLILMDDMMPELSGTDTMMLLRKIKGFNTPIIILTANIIDGAENNYLKAGFDSYLAKPIKKAELVKILRKFIIEREIDTPILTKTNNHTLEYLTNNKIIVSDALEVFKTSDNYDQAIKEFLKNIALKIVTLSQYKLSHNLADYALIVHSLRDECQKLGLNNVSNLLYNHELKSRKGNVKYIDEHFDELLNCLNNDVTILKNYIND